MIRLDGWSLLPLTFAVFSLIAYRGARRAALHYAVALATTYDLHRFDMLKAMHRPLPDNADEEYTENRKLTMFLQDGRPIEKSDRANWRYSHPTDTVGEPMQTDGQGQQGELGSEGNAGPGGNSRSSDE
jgi:hypothetical protein